jgi:hypothetical protein
MVVVVGAEVVIVTYTGSLSEKQVKWLVRRFTPKKT